MLVELVDGTVTSALRRAVLRPGWPTGARMHGDEDPSALHLAARDADGNVLGACVLLERPYPLHPERPHAWQLRGMVTAEGLRGRGIGAAVLTAAVDEVRRRGGRLLWCQARDEAIGFYARHGFVEEGEYFVHEETGIVHRMMYLDLVTEPFRAPTTSGQ
jgi:predicted GNAT family N-acyltransferase